MHIVKLLLSEECPIALHKYPCNKMIEQISNYIYIYVHICVGSPLFEEVGQEEVKPKAKTKPRAKAKAKVKEEVKKKN